MDSKDVPILPNMEGKNIRASFVILYRTPFEIVVKTTFKAWICHLVRLTIVYTSVMSNTIKYKTWVTPILKKHPIISHRYRWAWSENLLTSRAIVEFFHHLNYLLVNKEKTKLRTTASKFGLRKSHNGCRGLSITGLHLGCVLGSSLSTPRFPGW